MSNTAAADAENTILRDGADAEKFFQLGMMYSNGNSVAADMVAAHKWFNIAALRGNGEAARLRREIAGEMSEGEIAAAQRAARVWLTRHTRH